MISYREKVTMSLNVSLHATLLKGDEATQIADLHWYDNSDEWWYYKNQMAKVHN